MTKELFGLTPERINSRLSQSSNPNSEHSEATELSPSNTFYIPDELNAAERVRISEEHRSPDKWQGNHSSIGSNISDVTVLSVESETLKEAEISNGESNSYTALTEPEQYSLQEPCFDLKDILQAQQKKVSEISVFDACVLLQAGFTVRKKKRLRSLGIRRMWLNSQCTRICWTSKKSGLSADCVHLEKVVRIRNSGLKVSIHLEDGYRLSLVFRNQWEADVCLRALSGLIRSLAHIDAPADIVLSQEDRRTYSLMEDTFNGRPLRDYRSIHSYILLSETKNQPHSRGLHLVYSRVSGFRCMRYIPSRMRTCIASSQQQRDTLLGLKHPNLVKYYEILPDTEKGGCYMIHENVSQGSLFDCKNVDTLIAIPEGAARTITRQTLNALSYLHFSRIAHGSIRPGTVMRGVDGSVKLDPIGFISFKMKDQEKIAAITRARSGRETTRFMSPEFWLSTPSMKHSAICKTDIWSVGILCFGLLYGDTPFDGDDKADVQKNICTKELKFPDLPHTSRKAKDLLRRILGDKDPKTRIRLDALQRHSWFKGLP